LEAEMLDKYSVEHLLLQLEKLRKIALADGQIIVTEMTKKQRVISGAKLVHLNFSGSWVRAVFQKFRFKD
jgi:hypothetical protein